MHRATSEERTPTDTVSVTQPRNLPQLALSLHLEGCARNEARDVDQARYATLSAGLRRPLLRHAELDPASTCPGGG